jgi:hypothetical protein
VGCPQRTADKTAYIPRAIAQEVISEIRDKGFCRLCGSYTARDFVYDGGSSKMTLTLAGKRREASEQNGDPPKEFWAMEELVEKVIPPFPSNDPRTFSPDRKAECEAVDDLENQKMNEAFRK